MNIFKFPVGLCKEMDALIAKFWWGDVCGGRKIHWVAKETMNLPKQLGGLGFRNFMDFNDALLAKQYWRLIIDPDSLWTRVMKARYFPSCSFLDAKKGGRASWAWSSLLVGRDLIRRGAHWQIMCGEGVRLWVDRWLPSLPLGHPIPRGR